MDVRRLELLLALSRLGSMHSVSEALGVTTSTVSQQIAALTKEVGLPLIEPDGRRVRLTPAGGPPAAPAVAASARRREGDASLLPPSTSSPLTKRLAPTSIRRPSRPGPSASPPS